MRTLASFDRRHPVARALAELARELGSSAPVARRPAVRVAWSVGQRKWIRVPWIALLDERETRTRQEGLQCVWLFRQDLSGVYLALTQGTQKLKREVGGDRARAILRQRAVRLRRFCDRLPPRGFRMDDMIDPRTDPRTNADYDHATVTYKLYEAGEIPDDATLTEDLEALLAAYGDAVAGKVDFGVVSLGRAVRESRTGAWERSWEPEGAIAGLREYLERRQFHWEPWQIASYVMALRTKPFVILAGVTGTGKSKLPALVAEATGGASRLIPVRPDWTDSAELLGYTDLRGVFRPGALLRIAREAADQPERQWTAILDEMNLARVEHYFAEVLSRIEDRRPAPGGGWESSPLLLPSADAEEWAEVALPPNLALVGTVNMDESAHGFSRKVLDRAFTIELSDVDLSRWEAREGRPAEPAPWPPRAWEPRAIRLGELRDLSGAEREEIGRAIQALGEVNRFLQAAGLQIGYRTRDEIALFVLHATAIRSSFVTRSGVGVDPLDLGLHMKILPRIVGGSAAVRRAVLELLGWVTDGATLRAESDARPLLDGWEAAGRPTSLSHARFPHTAARLCLMWERLQEEGYTSFWL